MKYCPFCGYKLDGGFTFCPKCGGRVSENMGDYPSERKKNTCSPKRDTGEQDNVRQQAGLSKQNTALEKNRDGRSSKPYRPAWKDPVGDEYDAYYEYTECEYGDRRRSGSKRISADGRNAGRGPYTDVYVHPERLTYADSSSEEKSFRHWILGFLLPVVGLVLYLTMQLSKPGAAKSSGRGALVKLIVDAVAATLFMIAVTQGYIVLS